MKIRSWASVAPLITRIHKLFSEDLAKENDFLRQENKILRSKLGKRIPLADADRRILVRFSLPIRARPADVISIVRPETLLAWNRRMGCTPHPDAVWIQQQARTLSVLVAEGSRQASYLIHDRDTAFMPFDPVLRAENVKVIQTPPQAPMCNAYAERFVRETRETRDNLILLGEHHFHHVLKQIEHHHNRQRPHQGIDNVIPMGFMYPHGPVSPDSVCCESGLGGLLNHYYEDRKAA